MFPMKRNIYSGLQHPLLLLVVGALISSYIIPLYTKAWQDHQKELELKTDLVSEISDATASILTKTQVKKAVSNAPYSEFYNAYEDWESSRAIIQSKINAYFSNSDLPPLWSNYSLILTDFTFLSISGNTCATTKYVREIQKYFDITPKLITKSETNNCPKEFDTLQQIHSTPFRTDLKGIEWDYLIQHGNETHLSHSWLALKENMVTQKDRIIQKILNSQLQVFS